MWASVDDGVEVRVEEVAPLLGIVGDGADVEEGHGDGARAHDEKVADLDHLSARFIAYREDLARGLVATCVEVIGIHVLCPWAHEQLDALVEHHLPDVEGVARVLDGRLVRQLVVEVEGHCGVIGGFVLERDRGDAEALVLGVLHLSRVRLEVIAE